MPSGDRSRDVARMGDVSSVSFISFWHVLRDLSPDTLGDGDEGASSMRGSAVGAPSAFALVFVPPFLGAANVGVAVDSADVIGGAWG